MRIMIVGAGQVGYHLCEKLSVEGQEVVLVDTDNSKLRRIERELNILPMLGSGASARVLEEAGIERTDLFIAVTDSDEVNLISCIMSKQYNAKTRVARVRNEDFYATGQSLSEQALGIDLLISPDHAMTEEIIELSIVSDAFDVAEFADGQVELLGYEIFPGNPRIGCSLQKLQSSQNQNNFVMVAILREGATIIPRGDDTIMTGDKIYLVVRKKDLTEVESLFNFTSKAPRNVFIVGGGTIGYMVAREMEKKKINVRLVEENSKRCDELTGLLQNTVVLNFDGLEAHDLQEEGIDQADLVISVTDSDTTNILSSLLAKHHGAKKCITHISRPDFIPLLGKLGIDVALSPRLVAANMILRFVRGSGSNIISATTLKGSDAEVVEIKVPNRKDIAGIPLKSLNFPKDAILAAIVRKGKVIIPSGETSLKADDNLVIFFTRGAIKSIEAFFE